jgi:PadR family transcriptional regulator, regulatory protein PadR
MDGASDGWTRVWLVPFLLLSMRGGDLYGHELLEKLDELGFGETRPGEVYMTLRTLQEKDLTFSERGTEHLFSRRRYGLTELGEVHLESLAQVLDRCRREIELFFLLYEEQPVYEVRR